MKFDRSMFIGKFSAEAEEHLQKLNEGILSLERGESDPELMADILRAAHTLKGSARMMGFKDINAVAHKLEDLLLEVKEERLEATPASVAFVAKDGCPARTRTGDRRRRRFYTDTPFSFILEKMKSRVAWTTALMRSEVASARLHGALDLHDTLRMCFTVGLLCCRPVGRAGRRVPLGLAWPQAGPAPRAGSRKDLRPEVYPSA